MQEISERAFQAYCASLENVLAFKYLGRVVTAVYDKWLAVVGNLMKARKSSGRMSRVLGQEGADPKVSGHFSSHLYRRCCSSGKRLGY